MANENEHLMSRKKMATLAGLIYLLLVLTGFFSLRYVPARLIVWDNAAATFNNIVASETLFKLGILSGIIGYTGFLVLPFVLYRLLHHINRTYAVVMVVFAVVSVPLSYSYLLDKFAVLTLIHQSNYLRVFSANQLQALVLMHLHFYDNGILLASIFWGLWLFPFGYLVFKSEFLPKVIGILLMVGCFGYQIDFLFHYFMPDKYDTMGISNLVRIPGSLGELGICLWLLIVGTREKRITPKPN